MLIKCTAQSRCMTKGNNPQFSLWSFVLQVPGPWDSFCLACFLLPLQSTHTCSHLGGPRRSGLSRGEKEWEPSGMFAREKPLPWFRGWTECERDKAGKPINVLPCFLKQTSLWYSQHRISWHHRIFSPGKFMNPLKFLSIQARWCYQPSTFLYAQHHPSRLNHHYLSP